MDQQQVQVLLKGIGYKPAIQLLERVYAAGFLQGSKEGMCLTQSKQYWDSFKRTVLEGANLATNTPRKKQRYEPNPNLNSSVTRYLSKSEARYMNCFIDNNFNVGNTSIDLFVSSQSVSMYLKRAEAKLPTDFFINKEEKTKHRFRNVLGVTPTYLN